MKCKECNGQGYFVENTSVGVISNNPDNPYENFKQEIKCTKCKGTGQDNKEYIKIKKITMEEAREKFEIYINKEYTTWSDKLEQKEDGKYSNYEIRELWLLFNHTYKDLGLIKLWYNGESNGYIG